MALPTLKKRRSFIRVSRYGAAHSSKGFILVHLRSKYNEDEKDFFPSKNFAPLWFGFTASRKVGKAHDRNKAKRRLRELARLSLPKIDPILRREESIFHMIVLVARKSILRFEFIRLQQDMDYLIKKALSRDLEFALDIKPPSLKDERNSVSL